MPIPQFLQKFAEEEPSFVRYARDNPEGALVPVSALIGGTASQTKRRPITSFLRGGAVGAGTGLGAILGAAAGRGLEPDTIVGPASGGLGGGLLGYLAMQNLLPKDEEEEEEKRGAGPAIKGLLDAKRMSDVHDYHGKHKRLRSLIDQYPSDFFIDSLEGNIVGITHRPTGFRIHAPMRILPGNLRHTITNTTQGGMADDAIPAA